MPLLEAKVHDTVALAADGSVLPELLDALVDADGVDEAALDEVADGVTTLLGAAQPTAPTIAAAESPPRNARRVTVE